MAERSSKSTGRRRVMTDLKEAIDALAGAWGHTELCDVGEELEIVLGAAKAHLAAQEDGDPASRWKPVEDGLPKYGQEVWVTWRSDGDVDCVTWKKENEEAAIADLLAWKPADVPAPYQPPEPVDPLTVMREALEEIAKSENLYANQQIAREALAEVKGENNDNTC